MAFSEAKEKFRGEKKEETNTDVRNKSEQVGSRHALVTGELTSFSKCMISRQCL